MSSVPPQMDSGLFPPPPPSAPEQHSNIAPVWLQRVSLVTLVNFCVILGVVVAVMPWTRLWDDNFWIPMHPGLAIILHNGAVRGFISGIGVLDVWIGITEAVHYRDYRG